MLSDRRLSVVAELIRDHVSLDGIDRYCAETGVQSRDFVSVEPSEFDGEVFAIDGSNVSICSWSAANLNLIRAGYAVYRGRDWQRTVITYDDIFLADPRMCKDVFDPYWRGSSTRRESISRSRIWTGSPAIFESCKSISP